ncbi:MAG: ABC transporter permease [Candidatus Bathyarchaeota archaeon]|nr:ABC transporter permease [Candidatus Bathyarchaeota archaeon]
MDISSRWQQFKVSVSPTLKELRFTFSRIKQSPISVIGLAILILYILIALLAPVLAPPLPKRDPYMIPQESYIFMPNPPSEDHIFGTTENQYDLWYGCIWGTRTAFRIGFMVVVSSLAIGLLIGCVAGYYGGIIDELMMRFTDIIFAFPGLVLAMAFYMAIPDKVTILQFGEFNWTITVMTLDKVLIALVLVGWPSYTRVIRGEILRVRTEDYIEAAKAAGCSDFRVLVKHVIPNSIYPIVIMASLDIGAIVLTAAAMSFLGIGAQKGYADWGQLISLSRNWIFGNMNNPLAFWHVFLIPGIFIFTFVLGWNLLGDAFRDMLDPTIRRR